METAMNEKLGVRVEIAEETLARLLTAGQVCAAELRCLDCQSKQCLWRICLESCARSLGKDFKNSTACKQICCVCGNGSG